MPHFISCKPGALLYSMVMVKLTAPSSKLSPSRCTANTSVSIPTAAVDSSGYSVYPSSTDPNSVLVASGRLPDYRKIMLKLFNLGSDMSAAPISSGYYRFPPAPITNGITNRKIIASPWSTHIGYRTVILRHRTAHLVQVPYAVPHGSRRTK